MFRLLSAERTIDGRGADLRDSAEDPPTADRWLPSIACAEPLRDELTEFITYDTELSAAAAVLGLTVAAPQ